MRKQILEDKKLAQDPTTETKPSSKTKLSCLQNLSPDVCTWVQLFSSVTQLCLTLCNAMDCSTPGFLVHHQLLELIQTHVHWVGDAIQLPHPLSSPSPPAFNLSQHQGLFQWVSSLHQLASKYWSFSFSISPSREYSGVISFRMEWLDLLAVQGTLKSILQHHSSKASILRCSAFFIWQKGNGPVNTSKSHQQSSCKNKINQTKNKITIIFQVYLCGTYWCFSVICIVAIRSWHLVPSLHGK